MNRGGAEREGDTESEAGSKLWAVSTEPDAGLELTNREIVTWGEAGHSTDWATQVLLKCIFKSLFIYLERERERERERENEWGKGKERGRESQVALHGLYRAWGGAQTHKLWDRDLSRNQESDA